MFPPRNLVRPCKNRQNAFKQLFHVFFYFFTPPPKKKREKKVLDAPLSDYYVTLSLLKIEADLEDLCLSEGKRK